MSLQIFFPAIKDENLHSVHVCVHHFAQAAFFFFLSMTLRKGLFIKTTRLEQKC